MTQHGEEVEQDLSHIHWSWPEAIAANPERSLATSDLALDYFAYSPFWDSKSNNNVLRTQRRVENPTYGHAEEKVELNAFTSGFEYIVAHSQPPELFVIHRREVEPTGRRDRVTGAWFVLHDKVYQCPTLFDVVSTRLKNAASLVSKTLNTLSENKPPANPRSTTIWRAVQPSASTSSSSQPASTTNPVSPDASAQQRAQPERESVEDTPDLAKGKDSTQATTATASGPDWHLFHALQSTRTSLSSLDTLARTSVQKTDPNQELKNIETQMGLQFAFQSQSQGQTQGGVRQGLGSRSGSLRGSSVSGLKMGLSPATTQGGLTLGISPQAQGGYTPDGMTPRPGIGARIPSVAGSVLGGGAGAASPLATGYMA
ncbi:hypothetical protein CI109_101662 [Kwoniella shandongensis]|uniref:Mediator of RNA polymerase II transcription subunit 6 n=1 Tax=Kwoniella shandongensis TaxID=1734106 RepID=A0A5M6C6G8_9TREE|nr:uncharacterized protein CI109_001214 [Kwoniella shandongensis]KAA5530411.1 hypothetical protein CI109_001214 [Kwoniella shandongensis]